MTALQELRELRRQKELREPPDVSPKSPKSPKTSGTTLSQFAGSGRVIVIYSATLEEEIIFAADNARLPEGEVRPVYRARELRGLTDWSAEGLRLLHETKTRFGAPVEIEPDATTLTT